MRTRTVLTAGLLCLALAGCADKTAEAPAQPEDQGVKYSQCMRENGVPSFPDPVDGRLQLKVRKGTDLDPENPAYQKAEETCKPLQPAGLGRAGQDPQQQEQMLKWVACMRANGVPNMPDPQPDGRMLITGDKGSGVDMESPTFKAAQTKCRDLQPGGGS